MANRMELIECFKDTRLQTKQDAVLSDETRSMQAATRLYLDDFTAVIRNRKREDSAIFVVEDTTFSCARKWKKPGEKIAVLNFANAYHPGGNVTIGAMAQEECLCRSSNLYEALTLPYIVRHYYKWNQKNTGDMGSDLIVYSPGVTVFKSDDDNPVDLPKDQWFSVDVITCAAPYYDKTKKKPVTMEKLRQVFYDRIKNILEVSIANNVDTLILGAFGCGAFYNPPGMAASVFKELLVKEEYAAHFKTVVFAIKRSGEPCPNLEAFQATFSEGDRFTEK